MTTTDHTETTCPGSGTRWIGGTGTPICRVCHRGWRSLGLLKHPRRVRGKFTGTTPIHYRPDHRSKP